LNAGYLYKTLKQSVMFLLRPRSFGPKDLFIIVHVFGFLYPDYILPDRS